MTMLSITTAILLLLSTLPALAQDIVYDAEHNQTVITGTWSSGSQKVLTGPDFANPANMTFNYPECTGVSFSFSDDGFYEVARYRFNSNGSQPTCITGVLNWAHGRYDLLGNGSIVLTPLGDGFQQIQDPCAAQSNFIENFNITELFTSWRIFEDPQDGYKLHLFQFDGSPVAPQFLVSPTPNMLPTQMLRNVTPQFESQDGFVSTGGGGKRVLAIENAASRRWTDVDVFIAGVAAIGSMSLLLL